MERLAMASASMTSFFGTCRRRSRSYFANNSRTGTRYVIAFRSGEYAAVVEIGRHVWGLYPVIMAVEARGNNLCVRSLGRNRKLASALPVRIRPAAPPSFKRVTCRRPRRRRACGLKRGCRVACAFGWMLAGGVPAAVLCSVPDRVATCDRRSSSRPPPLRRRTGRRHPARFPVPRSGASAGRSKSQWAG